MATTLVRSVIWDVEFYPTARKDDIEQMDPAQWVPDVWELTDDYDPNEDADPKSLDPDEENNRYQRKWIAVLTEPQWRKFAKGLQIDLDEDGNPERGEPCLGQLLGIGHLPDTFAVNLEPMDWNVGGVTPVWDASVNVSRQIEAEAMQ
jgi:hypothetical protein